MPAHPGTGHPVDDPSRRSSLSSRFPRYHPGNHLSRNRVWRPDGSRKTRQARSQRRLRRGDRGRHRAARPRRGVVRRISIRPGELRPDPSGRVDRRHRRGRHDARRSHGGRRTGRSGTAHADRSPFGAAGASWKTTPDELGQSADVATAVDQALQASESVGFVTRVWHRLREEPVDISVDLTFTSGGTGDHRSGVEHRHRRDADAARRIGERRRRRGDVRALAAGTCARREHRGEAPAGGAR